ncbi:hypothetical protein BGX34_006083 [Mortierella sp. NVP85]|nr:hypothetical protein BGX34_006083 [Mortierella sp. NVP85]
MEATQPFRLIGTSDIKNIPCDHLDGQGIVYWDDIEQVFPGVKYVERGNVAINLLRDSNRVRIVPHCIKHHPDVVLDVVLSSTSIIASPSGSSSRDSAAEAVIPSIPTSSIDSVPSSEINISLKQTVSLSQVKVLESDIEQRLMASLSQEDQAHVLASLNGRSIIQAIKEDHAEQSSRLSELYFACFQELKEQLIKYTDLMSHVAEMQEEMERLQIQAPSHLTLLARRTQVVLTQTYGLLEYPIPRMFVVLPKDSSGWDYTDPSANKFRLYFLCECQEQTLSTNSRIPHHIHLAKHEGYDIPQATEFFQLYGSYVLTILRMLKFDIPVAGVDAPALMHLVHTDLSDQPAARIKELAVSINRSMSQVIGYIEKVTNENGNNGAWEGVDPQKFKAFLKSNDGNKALGDLYRVVSAQDHIKWVCADHYRENYQKATESFSKMVTLLKGSFDEHVGRVHAALSSKASANQFYPLLERTKSVYDLKIELNWDTTHSDFMELRDTIRKTNVEVVELVFGDRNDLVSDILIHAQRYDPILDIMRCPSIKTFTLTRTPTDFFSRSSLSYCRDGFDNLKHLEIDLLSMNQVPLGLRSLVAKAPNLVNLNLIMYPNGLPAVYGAIMEHQMCPVFFKQQSLRILPPTSDVRQAKTILRSMEDLFRIHGRQVEAWDLMQNWMGESVSKAFVETTRDGSQLKELSTHWFSVNSQSVEALSSIFTQSELRRLKIYVDVEAQRASMLKSIQWNHLRELEVLLSDPCYWVSTMETLADSMTKTVPKMIKLEHFQLRPNYSRPNTSSYMRTADMSLRSILSSRKLKHLVLDITMTAEQAIGLLRLVDVSQLQHLVLRAESFTPNHVQTVLDIVEHSSDLRTVHLPGTSIDKKQQEQMNAREVSLIGN